MFTFTVLGHEDLQVQCMHNSSSNNTRTNLEGMWIKYIFFVLFTVLQASSYLLVESIVADTNGATDDENGNV